MANNDSKSQVAARDEEAIVEPETRRFSIATWNMDHWKRNVNQRRQAWSFLHSGQFSDVALLQECVRPPAGN